MGTNHNHRPRVFPPASGTPDRSLSRRHVCPARLAYAKEFRDPLRCEKYFVPTRPPPPHSGFRCENRDVLRRPVVRGGWQLREGGRMGTVCLPATLHAPGGWGPLFGTDRLGWHPHFTTGTGAIPQNGNALYVADETYRQ